MSLAGTTPTPGGGPRPPGRRQRDGPSVRGSGRGLAVEAGGSRRMTLSGSPPPGPRGDSSAREDVEIGVIESSEFRDGLRGRRFPRFGDSILTLGHELGEWGGVPCLCRG